MSFADIKKAIVDNNLNHVKSLVEETKGEGEGRRKKRSKHVTKHVTKLVTKKRNKRHTVKRSKHHKRRTISKRPMNFKKSKTSNR